MNKSGVKRKMTLKMMAFLQLAVAIYTTSGIAAKLASRYVFLSPGFILCYGAEILILGVYAVIWQQIIKRVDISVAYTNRSVSIFWSMLWSVLIFHENVTFKEIAGVILIFAGTLMVNSDE